MSTYALAGMLGQGKAEELRNFCAGLVGSGKAQHDEYLRRYHLTKEYGWIQATPMGDMYILYFETTSPDFLVENRKFATSTDAYDVWYRQTAGGILGVDFGQPLPAGFVENVYMARESMAGAFTPTAVAAQVLPGKTDAVRELAAQLTGPKMADYQDYHRRYATNAEDWYLEHTPQGDLWLYYIEATDPAAVFQAFGASQHPFDVWLRQTLLDINGIDYSKPLPAMPEMLLRVEMPATVPAGR